MSLMVFAGVVLIAAGLLMLAGNRAIRESNDYWSYIDHIEGRNDLTQEQKLQLMMFAERRRYEETR